MKKQYPPTAPKFGWRRQRSRHGLEFFHYPSDFARRSLLYPLSLGRASTPPGDRFDHQTHDRYLLHFVLRGELWHTVRNQRHMARRGDACLMDLGEDVLHGTGGSQPAVMYWVSFNGKEMPRYHAELRADRDPVFRGVNATTLTRLFRELMGLTAKEDLAYELRASGLLALLLAELYSVRAEAGPLVSLGADEHLYSAPVRKGIDWIVRHYEQAYSLKELCATVGYSRSHYTRLFRRETGVPPVVWLNRYRIEQAKRLLTTTSKSVAEVAYAVAIADPNYFARLFRSLVGMTPREFRRLSCAGPSRRR